MSESSLATGWERRKEDYGLITGRAHYVDDVRLPTERPPVLHMAVVRSPYAHAVIQNMQLDAAHSLAGVVAAFEAAELVSNMPLFDILPQPPNLKHPKRLPLAVGKVRYIGDPVAVVLAEDLYTAVDARDLVEVDYEPLPAVTALEGAVAADAPLLYDEFGSNVAFVSKINSGDVADAFQQADGIVRLRLVNQRLAPTSIEPRGCLFDFDASRGQLSAWVSSQSVYAARDMLAKFLQIDRANIRVHNAEVGGAFGVKTRFLGEEIVAAALAVKYGRPVKWVEGRNENLQAQMQGRGLLTYVEAAFQNDGRLLGLKVRSLADLGAFLTQISAMIPARTPMLLSGPYQLRAIDSQVVGVFTNKVPTAAYRGAGRPEATYILERVMDRIADELHMDPGEVRRCNFIPLEAFPYTTVTGVKYDSGNYRVALDRLLELADYKGWRAKQQQRRQSVSSKLLGIGLATFNELSGDTFSPQAGMPREAATVRVQRDGTLLVQSGVSHNGQGHFTVFAQLAATTFGLPASQVEVRMNDTTLPGFSMGTFSSRVTQIGGSAILLAAQAVREKALQVAAQVLEAAPGDLVIQDGQVIVRGVPAKGVTLGELARMVEEQPDLIEREQPNPTNGTPIEGLAAWRDFAPSGASYSSGAHLAVVEIDSDTGEIEILSYVAVDDCGHVLNHYLVEAQLHGGLAQGIGQALFEEVVYDQNGQLLTGTLMDYALPIAKEIPDFVTDLVETPSPTNPLGAKGVGEAGCVGGPPTIVSAVLDALSPLGIKAIDMPLKAEKVWAVIQAAREGVLEQEEAQLPGVFKNDGAA